LEKRKKEQTLKVLEEEKELGIVDEEVEIV